MPAETPTAPGLPYEVRTLRYGPADRPTKFRHGQQTGEILTPDEVAVLDYVRHLEAERDRLRADLDAATAPDAPAGAGAHTPGQRRRAGR